MLSSSTLEFLETLCRTSHEAYPEGGILWTYTEAANQAHSRIHDPRVPWGEGAPSIERLGGWLQVPLGDWGREGIRQDELAQKLLAHLHDDLAPDQADLLLEDDGTSSTARIRLARASDNRYFELELWWSLD